MMLTWNSKGKIVGIETAFLHGNHKETIYMEIPKGMEENENEFLIIKKKNFHKKLVLALKGCGFQGNSVNPCLWTKYTEHGIVFVGIYVHDYLLIGNENGINDVINGLKTYKFGLKIANDLKDDLSCRILTDYERKTTFVMQPHLINNLKEKFEKEANNSSDRDTPGTPRFKIVRSLDETEKIDVNLQSKYRSGVEMLLYLIKYSRPDLANVVRELSKCIDGANLAVYKETLRVLKFGLDTKDYCLKLNPICENEEWDLVSYRGSYWLEIRKLESA
jgi:hypothetical protein